MALPLPRKHRHEKLYSDHALRKYRGTYKSWDHYQSCKAAYNKSVGMPPNSGVNCYSEFKSWAEANCNFTDQVAAPQALSEIHNAALTVACWFQVNGLEPQWLLKEVALTLLKYGTPLPDDVEENVRFRSVLSLSNCSKSKRQLNMLKCPMGGSVVYTKTTNNKKRKSMGGDEAADENAAEEKVDDAKKKRASKGSKTPKAPKFEEKLEIKAHSGERDKLFLDDLFTCILAPLQPLRLDQWNKRAIATIMSDGLKFALAGEISLNGKELKF